MHINPLYFFTLNQEAENGGEISQNIVLLTIKKPSVCLTAQSVKQILFIEERKIY